MENGGSVDKPIWDSSHQTVPVRQTSPVIKEAPDTNLVLPTSFVGTLTPGSGTPNVNNVNYWIAGNQSVVITNFLQGQPGQSIFILGDGASTVANNANISTRSGMNTLLSKGLVYHFVLFGTTWSQTA